jgi:Fe-S cluster assembly protein SufD
MSAVLDFPVRPEAGPYIEAFERRNGAAEPDWLARDRQRGLTRFAELGFPSRKSESWRYLDLGPLEKQPLLPAAAAREPNEGALRERLAALSLPERARRLVLVDGRLAPGLSIMEPRDGLWLGSMTQAVRERPELVRPMFEEATADTAAHPFAALNTAFFADGFVLEIAPGIEIERPIEIVHLASGATAASLHTRSLVALGAGSRARLLEIYAGPAASAPAYWRNDVVALRLAEGAELSRAVLVEEAAEAVHLARTDAVLGARARLAAFALLLKGQRLRHDASFAIDGEGAQCRFDAAYITTGSDETNIVTEIDHRVPGGHSSELIKGVAAERAHGAFQGRIVVREHAQKTDAHQLSRNLIIGERAVIDTKPELEIYADDVKCSHGASVGDLDEAALFYLRARGISAEEARRMLIDGFLREAVETVEDLAIRTHLLRHLARRLADLEEKG